MQVDPFPSIPPLAQAGAAVEAQRAGVGPLERLPRLAQRAPSMTPSLRRRALAALRESLQRQQQALYLPAADAAAGGSGGGSVAGAPRCHPAVAESAWRLAVLSADLADADLAVRERVFAELPCLARE